MKKLLITLCIGLVLLGCTKETTVIVVEENPPANNDLDGDGVKNIIEEIDGTDAHNGCDYLESSQNYSLTTEEWRNSDCDGDGVTNGRELDPDGDGTVGPDNTNPKYECDFTLAHQNYSITTSAWRMLDCDGDGVTNGDEVDPDGNNSNEGNGTDPLDDCDLDVSLQTLEPSQAWLEKDCDGDCVSNEQELLENTNPLNGDDYFGNGEFLSEIKEVLKLHYFDQEGTRLTHIEDLEENTLSTFNYTGDELTSAQVLDDGLLVNYTFDYQNNQLSQISKTVNGNTTVRNIEYVGVSIISHDSGEPPGLYREKLTFDSVGNKLITKEHFIIYDGIWIQILDTLFYENTNNTLSGATRSFLGYDPTTGEFFDLDPVNYGEQYSSFSLWPGINNPTYEATQKLKIQTLFEPDLLGNFRMSGDFVFANFETQQLNQFSWATDYVSYRYTWRIDCTNDLNNPTRGKLLDKYGFELGDLLYIYE